MCLIALAIGIRPDCPWLLASNRDEVFNRPTLPLHRWPIADGITVVAGRDERDGGTWLGVSEAGRVALLTNVRSPRPIPGQVSRGALPLAWLGGDASWQTLLAERRPGDFAGFNLITGDLRSGLWRCWSNRHPDHPHNDIACTDWRSQPMPPGIHSLSNATLNTPWPKAMRLHQALGEALPLPAESARQRLANALADRAAPADDRLPATGVPLTLERGLAPGFVSLPALGYGTRSSLIARADRMDDGALHIRLDEWTHTPAPGQSHGWSQAPPRTETWTLPVVSPPNTNAW